VNAVETLAGFISPAASTPYSWSFRPGVLAGAALVAGLYAHRLRRMRAEGVAVSKGALYARAGSFALGLAVIVLALVSPIDRLGEERLFSVHMAQHLLIVDIGPILLLLGLSRPLLRPLTRRLQPVERRLGLVASPLTALALLVAVLGVWHLPVMYELALRHSLAHELEHLTFLAAGTAFWWYVIEPVPPRHRLRGLATVAYVSGAKLFLSVLGVVLAFSPSVLYDTYERAPRTWGLSPLEDLNVGGLVMMVEQTVVLAVFFAIVFARMLDQSEQAERRKERLGLYP
jgi:cytochrome c oxidase assembly factor CtaG